jgi:hypothetical protein
MADEDSTTPESQEASEPEGPEVEAHSDEILGLQKLSTGSDLGISPDLLLSAVSCVVNSCISVH